MQIKLQVMICTHGDAGLKRVEAMHLPRVDGVGWIVSCQSEPSEIPQALQRDDVTVAFTPTKGLSNNRNHAISMLSAPYALIADDDLEYNPEALARLVEIFENDPQLDLVTLRCVFPSDDGKRIRPDSEFDLASRRKFYFPVSVEIALRTSMVRDRGLSFNPRLGAGAPRMCCGEEDVFFHHCRKAMRKGRYFPIDIAVHPGATTGQRMLGTPEMLRSKGAALAIIHPWTCAARSIVEAHRAPIAFTKALKYIVEGIVEITVNRE